MAILPGNRIRKNGVFGNTTDNPLTIGASTFNSPDLFDLPVVSGDHAIITLDPLKVFGDPEIVMVTAHTAAATVATITRGMFGTVARAHPQGTLWVHAATQDDFLQDLTSGTRPSDQYRGQRIYESDTNRFVGYSSANVWQQEGLFFDPPACRVFNNAAISVTNAAWNALTFNSERYNTDSMHSTSSNTGRITFNTAGLYLVTGHIEFVANATGVRGIQIYRNADADGIANMYFPADTGGVGSGLSIATVWNFIVGDFVQLRAYQTSGGSLNVSVASFFTPEFSATWIGRGN